jgi:hypothetical protein
MLVLDKWGNDHSKNGIYRNKKTKRLVSLNCLHHYRDGTERIVACFSSVRDGKLYGRSFDAEPAVFFDKYDLVELKVSSR